MDDIYNNDLFHGAAHILHIYPNILSNTNFLQVLKCVMAVEYQCSCSKSVCTCRSCTTIGGINTRKGNSQHAYCPIVIE